MQTRTILPVTRRLLFPPIITRLEMEERVAERFNVAVRGYKERKAAADGLVLEIDQGCEYASALIANLFSSKRKI